MTESKFYFNPHGDGLKVFLGRTEALLMEVAWKENEITVKSALFFLQEEKSLAYTTVMTILNRLTEKNLLSREKEGRNFIYRPLISRKEFLNQKISLIKSCLKQF